MGIQFKQKRRPGAAPGIEHDEITSLPGGEGRTVIKCTDYSAGKYQAQEIDNLDEFLDLHRPDWTAVRWVSVEGLSDMHVIQTLATKYNLHPLAVEDLLHLSQRPKIELYGGEESEYQARLFIVTRALHLKEGSLQHEQISMFLGHNTLLTFEEVSSDIWEPIRQRIKSKGSRLRSTDASFLAYSLLDAILDRCFPILEYYGDKAEYLDEQILERWERTTIHDIHQLKRDLLLLRWAVWPMREVISVMKRETHECVGDTTRVYLSDLHDHVVQVIEIIETYREIASDLTETYMSALSNRMNEVMKLLTLTGTIFIPLTFLAGVYGMNFHHFPELDQVWAYPAFWGVCVLVVVLMILFFHRRGWL